MKKLLLTLSLILSLFAFSNTTYAKEVKAAFVYVGPVGDGGWTYAHDLGRRELEKLGIETTYIESVPETDSQRVLRNLARRGYNVIFTTSFGFMDPTLEVAKQFPDVIFMHCSGFKTADNMGNYFARMYQAKYLAGMVAGLQTKTDKLGIIGSHPIPEIVRHINAFTLGARSVNPDATVNVIWVNSWFDPAKEGAAANTLMDNGADVVHITTDSAAATQAAEKRGLYAIGNDSDMTIYGPDAHLTAPIFNWGRYYVELVRRVQDDKWTSDSEWWGMNTGIVDLSKFGKMVDPKVQEVVNKKKQEIVTGRYQVFTGPIYDRDGKLVVEKDAVPTDTELLTMNYFVDGVKGNL